MNKDDYEILVNSMVGKVAPPDFAVNLLEDTCRTTGLDWKLRHVYLMSRGGKWAVTLSIDGFRLIGSQDPDYAGQEGPFWISEATGTWSDVPPDGKVYAAKVGIKHRGGFTTWGVAKFTDYKTGPMWDRFPSTMSAKCAEMLAWRKAFPGRLGGLYGLEEMAQADKSVAKILEGDLKSDDKVRTPENVDSVANKYHLLLEGAKSGDEIKEIGKSISVDKALSHEQTMILHLKYTKLKEKMI